MRSRFTLPLPHTPHHLPHPCLDNIDDHPQPTEKVSEAEAPSLYPHCIDEEINECPIADAEGEEDGQILPLIAGVDVQAGHIFNSSAILTISTLRSRIRVRQISPPNAINIRLRELIA